MMQFSYFILVGCWRHETIMCRPGLWRVVVCCDEYRNYDAVVDDFGNLVRVS